MFNVGYDALTSFFIDKAPLPYYNTAAGECKYNSIANLELKYNWLRDTYHFINENNFLGFGAAV